VSLADSHCLREKVILTTWSLLDIDALRASTTKQGGIVRQLKKDGAAQETVTAAVVKLKALKVQLEEMTKAEETVG
jgi:hypothetical protein